MGSARSGRFPDSSGARGGGGITGIRSIVGVELLVGCFEAIIAEKYSAHPAVYSSSVDGGAGPHDLIRGEPYGSTSGGASAAARRRQNA
jgi:hypothetical protein